MKKIVSIAILLIMSVVLINTNTIQAVGMIEDSGYAILDDSISENFNKEELESENMTINPYKVESNDTIYEKSGSIYIGENRVKINEKFPIITNNGNAINIVTNSGMLITDNFVEYEVFPNIFITNGALYQSSTRTRLDDNNYLLYKMENELYTSLAQIKVITNNKEYHFPANSLIKFNESDVKAYSLNGKILSYRSTNNELDSSTKIRINDKEYNYLDFINKISGKKESSEKENQANEEDKEENKEGASESKDSENKEGTSEEKNNETTSEDKDNASMNGSSTNNDNSSNSSEEKDPNYNEPSIILVDIDKGVYSLKPNFNIQDIDKNIIYPINIKVYQGDKMVLRKSIKEGEADFGVSGLKPDTSYSLTLEYKYLNSKGEKISKEVISPEVKTRSISELTPMEVSFEQGDIYNNFFELKNVSLKFGDDITKAALEKLVLVNDNKVISSFSSDELIKLKNEEILEVYNSSNTLTSNKDWKIEIAAYDRYENELPILGENLQARTSKLAPTATLKNKGNNFTSYEISYSLENKDGVKITNSRYEVIDENGDVVISDAITSDILSIQDLEPNSPYVIRAYGDYDLDDNNGLIKNNFMGELTIKTPPLNSAGSVNLNSEIIDVSSDSFKLNLSINTGTTNERLIDFIDKAILKVSGSNNTEIELSEEEKDKLKNGEELEFYFDKLKSNTQHSISLGLYNVNKNQQEAALKVNLSNRSVETKKKEAAVYIYNIYTSAKYATTSIYIKDEDNAIEGGVVDVKVTNEKGALVYSNVLETNVQIENLKMTNLEENKAYSIIISAAYYNTTNNKDTAEKNKVLKDTRFTAEQALTGVLRFDNISETQNGSLNLNFNINVRDNYSVLTDNKFTIKRYKENSNGGYELEETYEYVTEDTHDYLIREFNKDISINVPKGRYKFTVQGTVYGNEIELTDALEFTANRSSKIISSVEEIEKINEDPNYNYLIVKDLDFSKEELKVVEEVNGIIDFDGHKITLNVRQNTYNALFSRTGSDGDIRNINLNLKNYETGYDGKYGLIEFNYGKISNIQVTFNGNGTNESYNTSAISRENYGTIENFIVNVVNNITTTNSFGLVAINNYGVIKNGYIHGNGTIQVDNNAKSNRVIGGAIANNAVEGTVEGVYSYVVVNAPRTGKSPYIGNVIGSNLGKANNVYSDKIGVELQINQGPTIGYNNGTVTNSYYYLDPNNAGKNTNNSFNKIAEAVSLRNEDFIKSIYDEKAFNIDFTGETLYYPTLKSTEQMKFNQPSIEIPKDDSLNRTSLISTVIQNKTNTSAELKLNINNLNGTVTSISIPNTQVTEIIQETKGMLTTVIAKVKPDKYYENYNLENIKFNRNGSIETLSFTNNEIALNFDFYKPIASIDDWNKYMIDKYEATNTTVENYSLEVDLDFSNKVPSKKNVVIGKLKGNGKTISNLKLDIDSHDTAFIHDIKTSLEDLNFKDINLNIKSDVFRVGLIYLNSGNIRKVNFDNVNINKEKLKNQDIPKDIEQLITELNTTNWGNYISDAYGNVVAPIVYNDKLVEDVTIKNSIIIGDKNVGGLVAINSSYAIAGTGTPVASGLNRPNNTTLYPNATINNIQAENNIVVGTSNNNTYENYMGGISSANRAKLKNITVNNSKVLTRGSRIGGIVGNNIGEYTNVGELYVTNSVVYSHQGYVGGVVGFSNKCEFLRVGAMNTHVVGGISVGGVVGNAENLILEKVFINGGSVRGITRVGGILGTNGGNSRGDTIKDVYGFTDIKATSNGKNNQGVGSLVGYLSQGISIIENAFVGGTVNSTGTNEFVGIVGAGSNNTTIKNIISYVNYNVGGQANFSYQIATKKGKVENVLLWEGSSVNGNIYGNTQGNSVTTDALRTREFYTDRLKLSIENWSFSGLPQYMPKLIYNGASIPNQPNLAIPVVQENNGAAPFSINESEIPAVNAYTVSADSINLEFSKVNEDMNFEMFIGDKSVLTEKINKEIFTLQYDFVTPLRIELKKGNEVIETYHILPEIISRKVLLQDDKYYYITSEGIKSKEGLISGDFVNIYKGFALTRTGELIDINTGEVVSSGITGVRSLDITKPLFRFNL